ncbi:hypothetical protein DV737_g5008, partial [Chaetothyriales sp. CBS 132003]
MILLAEATRAKEIASILDGFRDYETNNRRAIDTTVTNLEDLSNVLRDLDSYIDARGGLLSPKFAADLELLQHSVAYTLGDLWAILGSMPDECIAIDYRDTWKNIVAHTESAGRQSLHRRIETYTFFATALCRELRLFITAAEAISDLSAIQQSLQRLAPPPASSAMIKQTRSVERVRPVHIPPKSPESVESRESQPVVPSPPLSPQSPPAAFSSIASQASSGEVETRHWANRIFKDLPSTKIVDGKNHDQRTFQGGLKMHYYLRGRDYRTKMTCEWPKDRFHMQSACLPLNDLHVKRNGSILYLCRPVAGYSSHTVWAQFKFPTLEWLIVFHLTFLALRSQDGRRQFPDLFDRELKGDTRYFAGAITDSGYHHALRLYRDRSTGVLRLEAAVLEGPMKDTPIWTAFITHQVTSPTWLERGDRSKRVYLADLKRHIFSSQYTPHIASSGQHVLAFDTISGETHYPAHLQK